MPNILNLAAKDQRSAERLQRIYDAKLIVPEKKPFLIDLRRSSGPYMAVDHGPWICDVASQIASLGLGFNAGALFGAAQYLESWINCHTTDTFQAVRLAYEQLLQRKLGSDQFTAHLCGSGTEAIETALAYFFDRRENRAARRVLAFEGSFHGRMMVALASTWNPTKREPFTWPGYHSIFAPYPEMDSDDFLAPPSPAGWAHLWSIESPADFEAAVQGMLRLPDPLLHREIDALSQVREHLISGDIFVILIEPMQCEGGDRYASSRFHQGLAYLAQVFGVPLLYDEIQTGFGLGGEFFWHRLFDLRRADGHAYYPNAVICAKKAQTGMVLFHTTEAHRYTRPDTYGEPFSSAESFSAAAMIRGYIQASVIDQFQDAILELENKNRQRLSDLAARFTPHIQRPRAKGVSFAFDLETPQLTDRFVANRFPHGLLYYPAGSMTARFRLNLAFQDDDLELFWRQLESALAATLDANGTAPVARHAAGPRDTAGYFAFHEKLLQDKLTPLQVNVRPLRDAGSKVQLEPRRVDPSDAVRHIEQHLRENDPETTFEIVALDANNYATYRSRILEVQMEVYEPARQTNAAEFDALFASRNPLGLLVLRNEHVVAMAFAGPLNAFPYMRGVADDPYVDDPRVAYALDLTVLPPYRGQLGRVMKQAILMSARAAGYEALHGRNRDRLAAGMWAINLSLGSFATRLLVDDYPDDEPHRDCIYYRCPTVWSTPPLELSSGINAPMGVVQLEDRFVQDHLPDVVNKLTLSNFVTERFLEQLEDVAQMFPAGLRHLYTANGTSECVDKVVKVLWKHRQPRTRLLTFNGHYFGEGSLVSRSLSGCGEAFFCVDRMELPGAIGEEYPLTPALSPADGGEGAGSGLHDDDQSHSKTHSKRHAETQSKRHAETAYTTQHETETKTRSTPERETHNKGDDETECGSDTDWIEAFRERLKADDLLAVFVEPMMQRTMQAMPVDWLARVVRTCREMQVPIVFHDTAGAFFRYRREAFLACGLEELQPDVSMVNLGGQMALVGMSSRYFIDEPLLLISTWEGDALSLAQFHRAYQVVQADPTEYHRVVDAYHEKLTGVLQRYADGAGKPRHADVRQSKRRTYDLRHGVGWISAEVAPPIAPWFRRGTDCWISCPSYSEMIRFLETDVSKIGD